MLIEQTTTYAYKLKYLENPSFDKVKTLAKKFIDELSQEFVDDLFNAINRDVDILKTEPEMLVYLYSFGNMHKAKLDFAFDKIPEDFFSQPEINIIDYGCGQAIGTMCYADFLQSKNYNQRIKSVTLIEPSIKCLRRAALHTSIFLPDADITTVNKSFDELTEEDINSDEVVPTLHILSNVLDLEFDLERFAELIKGRLLGYNQFVCVGPFFSISDKDRRMKIFTEFVGGNNSFSKCFGKGEFIEEKNWTCQAVVASVGELEEDLSTEVTDEDIENGAEDEFGGVYSEDGKKLLIFVNFTLDEYIRKKCTRVISDKLPTEYTIKEGTRVIGDRTFSLFPISLQHITIPNSVMIIGESAFYGCKSLQQITIPNSVTCIGRWAFSDCVSLQQIIISNSVTNIGCGAFKNCESLQQIIIPNSVTSIGDGAFENCVSLQHISIPNSVTCISISAFSGCKSLQQIIIPNSVRSIKSLAFYGCESLQHITIPNSVTSIGGGVFNSCVNISLNINSDCFIVKDKMLMNKGECKLISFWGKENNVIIPNSVKSIGENAFWGCDSLQQIIIPNSVTSIGDGAFENCVSVQHISIPNSVTSIGDSAFSGCKSLQQIIIPNSVTSIGKCAFRGCESFLHITIPNSVTSIGDNAFAMCNSLQYISIPNSVTSIGNDAFVMCNSLQHISIPNSVSNIGGGLFAMCNSLQHISIPNSVTSIDGSAFAWCNSLQQIFIPNSVTSICDNAFIRCKSLKQICIPDSVKVIGNSTFARCYSLQQISIPISVTSIGDGAFWGCKSLQQIIIPEGGEDHFKCMLPEELWDKLFYLKKAINQPNEEKSGTND